MYDILYDRLDSVRRRELVGRIRGYTYGAVRRLVATCEPFGWTVIQTQCACGDLYAVGNHVDPTAPNLLESAFAALAASQRWVSGRTEFVIGSGHKLYLVAVVNPYSRFIVLCTLSAANDRPLMIKA